MLPNVHLVYYGDDLEMRGLFLDSLDKVNLQTEENPKFLPGHRYIIIYNDNAKDKDGKDQPHQIIASKGIHYGPRRENFYDYTKCPYLTTIDGIVFKFIYKKYERSMTWLDEEQYNGMLPHLESIQKKLRNAELETGISKRTGKPWYRLTFEKLKDVSDDVRAFCEDEKYIKDTRDLKYIERIRTKDRIIAAFEYFLSRPDDEVFGYDYETCGGFPFEDPDFEVVGLGIADCGRNDPDTGKAIYSEAVGVYFDVQWMIYEGKDGEFEIFKVYLGKYLDKFENSVTYNNSFEQRVTYILLKRLCLFDEAATINKCDGLVEKRYSLKYTVQRVLGNKSWDDHFDYLTDKLDEMFSRNDDGEYYYNENTFEISPEFEEIIERFPEEKDEFIHLIKSHFGDPFACIPSNIQAQYCPRDAYYTGLIKLHGKEKYFDERRNRHLATHQLCWDTYNHNLQLEALLHLTGFFCDEDLRLKMELQCLWMVIYGKLNVTRWTLAQFMNWYSQLKVDEIPIVSKLFGMGYDPCSSKAIIMDHLSESTKSGIDEDWFKDVFGEEITNIFLENIDEYCYHIDESFKKSRKVYNEIDAELEKIFNPNYTEDTCEFTIDGKRYILEMPYELVMEYYSRKHNYEVTVELCNQLKFSEIEKLMLPHKGKANLPDKLTAFGVEYTLDDIFNLCDQFYTQKSAKEAPYFKFMAYQKFKSIIFHAFNTDYGSIPYGTHPELTEELIKEVREKDYSLLKIEETAKLLLPQDIDRLKKTISFAKFKLNHDPISLLYAGLMDETYKDQDGETWGFYQFKPTGNKTDSGKPIFEWAEDIDNWFNLVKNELGGGFFDFAPRYMGYWSLSEDDAEKFHENIDSIDIEGDNVESLAKLNYCYMTFKKYDKVLTSYIRGDAFYAHNESVSGFDENGITPNRYTDKGIHKCYLNFSANEKKSKRWSSSFHTIPSKAEMKRIVTCPPGYLMSYFDISGAEIRTISFMSKDDFMMQCYHDGKDPYITMAGYTFPKDDSRYSSMNDDEYKDFLKGWRGSFKQCLLGSLYGMGPDKMADLAEISPEECDQVQRDLWKRCPKLKEFIEAKSTWAMEHPGYVDSALGDILELGDDDDDTRYARLGINQFIQNYSSVSLADGFMNNLEKSIHHRDEVLNAPDFILRPLGVVHDSNQNYFPTKYLFEMHEYYTRNLSGYLFDLHQILYAFDLEIGTNYFDICDVNQLDPTHIEFTGSHTSLQALVNKCQADGLNFRVTKLIKVKKHQAPIPIEVNGFEFGDEFKPKLPESIISQFFDNNCYAKFCEDTSKFTMTFEKL